MPRSRPPQRTRADPQQQAVSPSKGEGSAESLDCFAVSAPGLEPLVAEELRAFGIHGAAEQGGVGWSGSANSLMLANLWLRTASRVVVRIAEFNARSFFELERRARRVPWERFVVAGSGVRLRVTSRKSKLYHTDAVAQRFGEAIERTVGSLRGVSVLDEDEGDEDERLPAQLFVVRVVRDKVTLSVDSSGEHLHRRGYRQAVGKAPLRETLAAAMLLGSGWKGDSPLLDPLCGSGTIPIEGAMIARRMAPGRARSFAFERWPEIDAGSWTRLRDESRARELAQSPVPIRGSDRDAGAVESARANAVRAGVAEDARFEVAPISAVRPEPSWPRGAIVSNPPYGVRVGETRALRDLYAALGSVSRDRFEGWRLAVLSASPELEAQIGVDLEERFRTTNGGIPVRLVVSTRGAAS